MTLRLLRQHCSKRRFRFGHGRQGSNLASSKLCWILVEEGWLSLLMGACVLLERGVNAGVAGAAWRLIRFPTGEFSGIERISAIFSASGLAARGERSTVVSKVLQ